MAKNGHNYYGIFSYDFPTPYGFQMCFRTFGSPHLWASATWVSRLWLSARSDGVGCVFANPSWQIRQYRFRMFRIPIARLLCLLEILGLGIALRWCWRCFWECWISQGPQEVCGGWCCRMLFPNLGRARPHWIPFFQHSLAGAVLWRLPVLWI